LLGLDEELDLADAVAELEVGALASSRSSTLWTWIWRLIDWISAMAAKSSCAARRRLQLAQERSPRRCRRPRRGP